MKIRKSIIALALAALAAPAYATEKTDKTETAAKEAAEKAALAWLSFVDGGKYAQAWEAASDIVKNAIQQEQFGSTSAAVRTPLGAVEGRKLKSATPATQLPGAPDGQYMVLLFDTSFAEKKEGLVETVILAKGAEGAWKLAGYWIRPSETSPLPAATEDSAKADTPETAAAKEAAKKAALAWLPLVDGGKYAQAWEASAEVARNAVSKEQFESSLSSVLKPLGAVESRKFKDATYTTQLPRLLDGHYVVVQFETVFANKKEAVIPEFVTVAKEKDGSWKVAGYFLR